MLLRGVRKKLVIPNDNIKAFCRCRVLLLSYSDQGNIAKIVMFHNVVVEN